MATESTIESNEPSTEPAAGRPLVLFVDDDRDARDMYRDYLRSMGCRVITAANGNGAIDQALQHRPDVIIMDLAMPQMDGLAATRHLRRQEPTRRVPIIALTAMPAARDSAREAGCDAFLAKPCLPELVWWEVRSLLTRMTSGRPLWPREIAGDLQASRPADLIGS
jgi:two-component system, cell cycle response regulator DivK